MIPSFLQTSDPLSFAFFTVMERFPAIIRSAAEQAKNDGTIQEKLYALRHAIPDRSFDLLKEDSDFKKELNEAIKENRYRWNDAPFIFAECYLYQALKEIFNYDNTKFDYFFAKKSSDAASKKDIFTKHIALFDSLLKADKTQTLIILIHAVLMGNTADLSHLHSLNSNNVVFLIDHTQKAVSAVIGAKKIDIILDNSGEELFYDIFFACYLLQIYHDKTVTLHFKNMPYFVSDALIADFEYLLEELEKEIQTADFVGKLRSFAAAGRLVLKDENVWTNSMDYRSRIEQIHSACKNSDLLIFKGDLNYRKLVQDRQWDYTTSTAELLSYLPADVLILRVLKSEIVTGLQKENIPKTGNNEWLFKGQYAVIEFIEK